MAIRVGVKYFSKYLSQVQVLFHICKYKYKFKYSEYLEDIKYIKYFFNQVQVKYKYFGNKGLRAPPLMDYAINHRISYYLGVVLTEVLQAAFWNMFENVYMSSWI